MATNLILSKESSESEIKRYFNAILKLSQSDNEFPVNFDEVWMLVYENKKSAIRELKDKFMQDVDFQTVRKKVQASNVAGFVYADEYHLSVPCLEFFIARKIRMVFEVYRKVFHKAVKEKKAVARTRYTKQYVEQLETRLKMYMAVEKQERELKCSCFHYLVETGQFHKWNEFHEQEQRRRELKDLCMRIGKSL